MTAATAANNHARIAAMETYLNAFLSGTMEPFWPHFVLLSVSVLAGIAVGAGIIFESSEYTAFVHRIAKWLVISGVVIESVCTVCLFVFDEGISETQQSKIITLERRIASRSINNSDAIAIIKQLRPFSGTLVDVYIFPAGTPDIVPLGQAIARVLINASWNIGRVSTASGGQYSVGIGVHVQPNADEKVKNAYAAIIEAFTAFDPNTNPDMSVTNGAFSVVGLAPGLRDLTRVPAQLTILVGTKP